MQATLLKYRAGLAPSGSHGFALVPRMSPTLWPGSTGGPATESAPSPNWPGLGLGTAAELWFCLEMASRFKVMGFTATQIDFILPRRLLAGWYPHKPHQQLVLQGFPSVGENLGWHRELSRILDLFHLYYWQGSPAFQRASFSRLVPGTIFLRPGIPTRNLDPKSGSHLSLSQDTKKH